MNRPMAVVPVSVMLACALVLAACGGGEPATTTTEPATSTPPTLAETTTTEATTDASTTTEASTTTTEAATTTSPATTLPPTTVGTEARGFPPERTELVHGGDAWVVVLAAGASDDDPALIAAVEAATEAGYTTGPTTCDLGAAEAIGAPEGSLTVSVYLMSETDAQLALAAFEAIGITGGVVAVVATYCLD